MIRVIYRWKVPEANQSEFIEAWERATCEIRASTEGAQGSFCIVGADDPTEVLTIASWEALDQWQAFIQTANLTSMKEMHALGERVSVRAYEQRADLTI